MKYIVTLIVLISSVAMAKGPKFRYGQEVKFKVPYFLSLVCSDKGTIESYEENFDFADPVTYGIRTNKANECPTIIRDISEKDISPL